jgi:hypothetical protein
MVKLSGEGDCSAEFNHVRGRSPLYPTTKTKWEEIQGRGSRYIPAGKLQQVERMIYADRCSVSEVLQVLADKATRYPLNG